jgi:hypothetical protein
MKPLQRPLPSSTRCSGWQFQWLKLPITPTFRAVGAQTVNHVPFSVQCAPITSNCRW